MNFRDETEHQQRHRTREHTYQLNGSRVMRMHPPEAANASRLVRCTACTGFERQELMRIGSCGCWAGGVEPVRIGAGSTSIAPIDAPFVAKPRAVACGPQAPGALERRVAGDLHVPAVLTVPMMRRAQRIAVVVVIAAAA